VLLLKEKAEVLEQGSHDLHWARGSLPRPGGHPLTTYVRVPRDSHKRKITRRAVFARDDWECQYCGARTA
jgi:5-methylcytosine-specific restriction endonuclease McrA